MIVLPTARNQPRTPVSSFMHMDPTVAYKQAKEQLENNFVNSYKIALDYMNKALKCPAIKPEDSNDLWSNALFLRSCYNIMQDIAGLKELENSTNLRIIVSKLPCRLQDRWQANVCSMQDKNDHRTIFKDLLEFIERQSRAMFDPVFGAIRNSTETKGLSKPKQQRTVKPCGRPSFATTVAHVSAPKRSELQSGNKQKACATKTSCLFCEKNHT